MLAPKKIEKKKMVIYLLVIAAILSVIAFLIISNFTSKDKEAQINFDLEGAGEDISAEETTPPALSDFSQGELDFVKEKKFRSLTDNFKQNEEYKTGNKNPFLGTAGAAE